MNTFILALLIRANLKTPPKYPATMAQLRIINRKTMQFEMTVEEGVGFSCLVGTELAPEGVQVLEMDGGDGCTW